MSRDVSHAASAGAENGWQAYSDKFLSGSEMDYQARVGGLGAIRKLPLPVY